MGTRAGRDGVKEAAWRRRLGHQAVSGQSVRAWCREHRFNENSFYWWRKELERRDAWPKSLTGQAASFVPVHVMDDPGRGSDSRIEILLADGRRVRLTGPVDREMLTVVLDVLATVDPEGRPC